MRRWLPLTLLLVSLSAFADQAAEQRAVIKEQELEQVRSRINELKASIDETFARYNDLIKKMESAAKKTSRR